MLKSLAALSLVAMTCACASSPGRPDGPPPVGPQVFVSPYGQPYRSRPGEPYPVAAWFATADADGDGRLTPAEFAADGRRFFVGLDTNADDVIGPLEITAYEAMTTGLFEGRGGPRGRGMGRPGDGRAGGPPGGLGLGDSAQQDGMGGGQRRGGARGGPPRGGPSGPRGGGATSMLAMAGLLNVPQPVKAADTDVNQRITVQEWTQVGDRWFRLLDADRDGALTLAELPQTRLQRGGGRRGPPR